MQKQASLLGFFKKSASKEPVKAPDNHRKHDEMSTIETQSSSEGPALSDTTNYPPQTVHSPIDEEDEVVIPKNLHKRLKKSVKIADEEEEEHTPQPSAKKVVNSKSIEIETETPAKKTNAFEKLNSFKENIPFSQGNSTAKSGNKGKPQKKDTTPTTTPAKGAKGAKGGRGTTPAKGEADDVFVDETEGMAKEFTDSIPIWAQKGHRKDAKQRMEDDPLYDPTTLYLPPGTLESKEITATMKQYWQIKSQNFDKIIFFKLGKFYELFYEDAIVAHKELDLNWMACRMHVGFPEKALDRYGQILVSRGYKVCVVEQTETPKQMEERLSKQASGKKEKAVKRAMVQVMSKGTYVEPGETNGEPRVLLALRYRKGMISVAFVEIGANIISVGLFKDDENYTMFKTFISQVRPVEIVYEAIETDPILIRIIKSAPNEPVISPLNDPVAWNALQGYAEVEKYYGPRESWPEALQSILKMESSEADQVMVCMSGLITFLTKMLIADNVLKTARYDIYDPATFKLSRMVLDSQALQHLEILEVGYNGKTTTEGSLLGYVDKTMSAFGKRMMRKWVCAPLLDVEAINDRLDAIEDLESLYELRDRFRKNLKALPDIERTCGRVYNQSVKKTGTVIMFEDIAGARLRDFKGLLIHLKKARDLIHDFSKVNCKSKLLKRLTTLDDYTLIMNKQSNNMPDVTPLIDEISKFLTWEGPKGETPVPREGVDPEYDSFKINIRAIEKELNAYLKEIQERFGGNRDICYAHTKHRYEIEVPSHLVSGSKKPRDFEFSSKKQERERFVTSTIKELVEKLEEAEDKQKNSLNVFVCFLFNYFHKHYSVWDTLIEGLAQLDCLCSLSMVSYLSDGDMCRPEVYPPNQKAFLDVRNMRHPCVSANKANFVSNDIVLGDVAEYDCNKNVMLLTGPNMGGKSTILRQACIAAVLAQIGCYVPASSCKMSVVDRIFTRLGASDKLSEGKSTFYIEMEETVNVMKYGSMNSLAIMDELGRGTSTFDGVAIAYSVLNYIVNKMGCRTMFATHYHVLLDEFRENNHITFFHMSSRIEGDKVLFLYKLIPGECSNSFGLNIAKISGINSSITQVAKEKADEFEKNLNIREAVQTSKAFAKITKALCQTDYEDDNIEEALNNMSEALELFSIKA